MESLALAFSSGWASGINSYLVVLVLGLADRFGTFSDIPDALGKWEVLAAAAVMYAFEFVADKVPYVDTVWDVVSTVIRPFVGGTVGVLIAGDTNAINDLVGGSVGGTSALASHVIKTSTRIAVNTSPEPFTNIAVSLGEDLLVLAVIWFAVNHPVAAAVAASVLLLLSVLVLWMAWKLVRRGWARFQSWRARRGGAAPGALT